MSEECKESSCAGCPSSAGCGSKKEPQDMKDALHKGAKVKKVIAVMSGKGGVGKSMVTSLLAIQSQRRGKRAAILDADITGPSIPQAFGIKEHATGSSEYMNPVVTGTGIQMISMNLLLPNPSDPVVWRGAVVTGVVRQFWTGVAWDDVDVMFVDMPPGTGDVPLTVFQSLPIDGIVVVASPQELVGMIVEKALKMANIVKIPILSLVENMSYYKCPDCGSEHAILGEGHVEELAKKYDIPTFCRLPIRPEIARATDAGEMEFLEEDGLLPVMQLLEK